MVLNVFRLNSRVHASRPMDSSFRRFVPDFADVTATFLLDLSQVVKDTKPQVDLKKPGELKTQRCPASKSSSSSPVLEIPS